MKFFIETVVKDIDVRIVFDNNKVVYIDYRTMQALVGKENIFDIKIELSKHCCAAYNSYPIQNFHGNKILYCPFCGAKK